MSKSEEFLIEEYKDSISTGQWLEEMLERKFKTFSLVFIWQIVLIGYLLNDSKNEQSVWFALQKGGNRELVIIVSAFVFLFSAAVIHNLAKTRIGDVLRTSRANFIRGYFLESMPETFTKAYFQDERMKHVNNISTYARPAWSNDSDVALYILLISIMGGISFSLCLGTIPDIGWWALLSIPPLTVGAFFWAKRKVSRVIALKPSKEEKENS
jgi:hypothetical protein